MVFLRAWRDATRIARSSWPPTLSPQERTSCRSFENREWRSFSSICPSDRKRPLGSDAECALDAGVAVVNNIPVFLASDPAWASRFQKRGLPIIGDDIKSQLGATIVHRILVDLFKQRGVELDRTYQLNVGGNTDFLNMLDRDRLASKRTSKTEAVQSVAGKTLDPRERPHWPE